MKTAFSPLPSGPLALLPAAASQAQPHNVIIFVADGLRYGSVEPGNMPNMAQLKKQGVDFTNSHSLYPTVTTVNASAIATGHYIGDTGDFGNTLYAAQPMISLRNSPVGFLENDTVLDEMNQKFAGNYLNETTLMAAARAKGWQTAVIGKEGPARIQDSTASPDGNKTMFLDDATGKDGGLGLPSWFSRAMSHEFVGARGPWRGGAQYRTGSLDGKSRHPYRHSAFQGEWKALFPALLVARSRQSQHDGKDSIGEYDPGINGPSGKAGTRDADTMLGELLDTLEGTGPRQDHRCFRHRRSWLCHRQPDQRHQPFQPFRRGAKRLAAGIPGDRPGRQAGHAAAPARIDGRGAGFQQRRQAGRRLRRVGPRSPIPMWW